VAIKLEKLKFLEPILIIKSVKTAAKIDFIFHSTSLSAESLFHLNSPLWQ
jgi:hypothetical protein